MALLMTHLIVKYDTVDGSATTQMIIKYAAAGDGHLDAYDAFTADYKIRCC